MNSKPIIIVWGEPNSIFSEIFFKAFKKYKCKKPIILIGSHKLFKDQIKKLGFSLKKNQVNLVDNSLDNLQKKKINFLDVEYNYKKPFERISSKSNKYLIKCFKLAFNLIKNHKISGLINGPISKKHFLKKKFQGITEFLANYYKVKSNYAMLIYSRSLSVLPVTTHYPIKIISSKIDKKSIIIKAILVNNFYKKVFSIKPKIAVCGLNPHCENFFTKSEENEKINPAIDYLKNKNLSIKGPFPADTIFMKHLRKNFDVIIGMYHDQVLTPMKALAGFEAINITLGLPFIRISPDHGPNYNMIGANKSNANSLINAIKFLD